MPPQPPPPGPDPTDGMAPVVRLLASLAHWVDANRALIEESNALLNARGVKALDEAVLPRAAVEVAETIAAVASSVIDISSETDADDKATANQPSDAVMAELLGRFQDPLRARGTGATAVATPPAPVTPTVSPAVQFIEEMVDRLLSVSHDARLVAAGLRFELARRDPASTDGEALRSAIDVEEAMLARHIEPWPLREAVQSAAEDVIEDAREAYRGIAISAARLAHFIDDRASDVLAGKRTVLENVEYLCARFAVFQNAALHLARECQPGSSGTCNVQDAAHHVLRDFVSRDAFAIRIDKFMRLGDHAGADDVDRAHGELELFDSRLRADAPEVATALKERVRGARKKRDRAPGRFRTVAEALAAAEREFLGDPRSRVRVTDQARASAEDSPFLRPDQVFAFFEALDKVARGWASNLLGRPFNDAMRDYSFGDEPISSTAMNRYKRHYQVPWNGRKHLMGSHWTIGARDANTCLSIHWYRDEDQRLIVVGHCGAHLPNTLS